VAKSCAFLALQQIILEIGGNLPLFEMLNLFNVESIHIQVKRDRSSWSRDCYGFWMCWWL